MTDIITHKWKVTKIDVYLSDMEVSDPEHKESVKELEEYLNQGWEPIGVVPQYACGDTLAFWLRRLEPVNSNEEENNNG